MKYEFIKEHSKEFPVSRICQTMEVSKIGYYAWLKCPKIKRVFNDEIILDKIIDSHKASGGTYGSPRIYQDLKDEGINCGKGFIFHSDRDIQYASREFRKLLKPCKYIQSMSRKGNCWDNACAESFFHSLKTEEVYFQKYRTRDEAKKNIFRYIEVFYNRKRRHSHLGYKSPENFERFGIKKSA